MAPSSPSRPPPPAWSVAVRLRHRGGLEIRASAENVLPGWGRGGERLSLLLRLRHRLILAVTSQCGPRAPAPGQPGTPPRGCGKLLRFLRSRWARLPTLPRVPIPFIWRRKKPQVRAAAAAVPGTRSQSNPLLAFRNWASTPTIQCCRAWTPTPAATLRFAVAAMAALAVAVSSIAVFRLTIGHWRGCREPIPPCESWRCFLAKKFMEFSELPFLNKYRWLLQLLKHGFKWLLRK